MFMDKIEKKSAGKIYIGSDIESFELKGQIKEFLETLDFLIVDLGVFEIEEPCDYTVIGREVAEKVLDNQEGCETGEYESEIHGCKVYGILLSFEGLGMYMAAKAVQNVSVAHCKSVEDVSNAKKNADLVISVNTSGIEFENLKNLISNFVSQ